MNNHQEKILIIYIERSYILLASSLWTALLVQVSLSIRTIDPLESWGFRAWLKWITEMKSDIIWWALSILKKHICQKEIWPMKETTWMITSRSILAILASSSSALIPASLSSSYVQTGSADINNNIIIVSLIHIIKDNNSLGQFHHNWYY